MNRDQLRAQQAPLEQQYESDPSAALVTLRATSTLADDVTCSVETARALVRAAVPPATGGTNTPRADRADATPLRGVSAAEQPAWAERQLSLERRHVTTATVEP